MIISYHYLILKTTFGVKISGLGNLNPWTYVGNSSWVSLSQFFQKWNLLASDLPGCEVWDFKGCTGDSYEFENTCSRLIYSAVYMPFLSALLFDKRAYNDLLIFNPIKDRTKRTESKTQQKDVAVTVINAVDTASQKGWYFLLREGGEFSL